LKRVTPTPNRFTISIRNWQGKSFALFASLVFLSACVDESSLIGFKKDTSRLGIHYIEFDLPATTIQADSLRTQNQFIVSNDIDRLLLGQATDPIFGNTSSSLFTKFTPASGKISGKNQVTLEKLTMTLALDYYVYGDTNSSYNTYEIHEITDGNFKSSMDYFNNSSVAYDANPLVTGIYYYDQDSVLKSRKSPKSANRVDTIYFDFPIGPGSLAQLLLDTALRKGIYTVNSSGISVFNTIKTDSVFQLAFNGLAIIPTNSNKILGIRSLGFDSKLTLYYSYNDNGVIKRSKYFYSLSFLDFVPSYSKIDCNRAGTFLDGITKYSDFNAPDGYCYLQSGTGLYTKLDISAVHTFFKDMPSVGINAAELVVPLEPVTTRSHLSEPNKLFLRIASPNNRFFKPPLIGDYPNPIYANRYYCAVNTDYYLNARGDDSDVLSVSYVEKIDGRYYSTYLSDFLEYNLHLPSTLQKVNSLALLPANAPYGKSFHGVSFKKDKIKLKVYYTTTL